MRTLISGSTGLLGRALADRLRERGDEVWTLDRHAAGSRALAWGPAGELAGRLPDGLDAVVHLSGSPILRWPWTRAALAEIRASRVDSTRTLSAALALRSRAGSGQARLLCASAVGIYRSGWPALDEEGALDDGSMLGRLCRDWEAAANEAREAGLAVLHLRTGLVLDPTGGLLARLLPLWRLGLGGRLGPAELPWSWIHREDWLGAVLWLLERPVAGPFNLCAPEPARQDEALAALGRVLGRRGRLHLPAPLLALLGGRMGRELLLQAPAVRPRRLLAEGFAFRHPELEAALADLLGVASASRKTARTSA